MLALPDDPDLLGRLATAIGVQGDPPISFAPCGQTVIAFESVTGETMLRGRVIQALGDVPRDVPNGLRDI